MELTYKTVGDYQIPNLTAEDTPQTIGKYGMMRLTHLKKHRQGTYNSLLLTGRLAAHLSEIDQTARERVEFITSQTAQTEVVTEQMKVSDPMKWTGLMNGLKLAAEEIVTRELVFA